MDLLVSSGFEVDSKESVIAFVELLRSHLLQEVSDLNHFIESMRNEMEVECEKVSELIVKAKKLRMMASR